MRQGGTATSIDMDIVEANGASSPPAFAAASRRAQTSACSCRAPLTAISSKSSSDCGCSSQRMLRSRVRVAACSSPACQSRRARTTPASSGAAFSCSQRRRSLAARSRSPTCTRQAARSNRSEAGRGARRPDPSIRCSAASGFARASRTRASRSTSRGDLGSISDAARASRSACAHRSMPMARSIASAVAPSASWSSAGEVRARTPSRRMRAMKAAAEPIMNRSPGSAVHVIGPAAVGVERVSDEPVRRLVRPDVCAAAPVEIRGVQDPITAGGRVAAREVPVPRCGAGIACAQPVHGLVDDRGLRRLPVD